jgi:hypothetical protein
MTTKPALQKTFKGHIKEENKHSKENMGKNKSH